MVASPLWLIATIFQFTPLCEGRLFAAVRVKIFLSYFNSRPCVRGDATVKEFLITIKEFQFTPLCEGRLLPLSV